MEGKEVGIAEKSEFGELGDQKEVDYGISFDSDLLTRLTDGLPREENLVVIAGEHDKSEPTAVTIAKNYCDKREKDGFEINYLRIPEGFDYLDCEDPDDFGKLQDEAYKWLNTEAVKYSGKVLWSFHETNFDSRESRFGVEEGGTGAITVDIVMVSASNSWFYDRFAKEMKELAKIVAPAGLIINTEYGAKEMADPAKGSTRFGDAAQNLMIVEAHTASEMYQFRDWREKEGPLGKEIRATGYEEGIDELVGEETQKFTSAISAVLPIATVLYQKIVLGRDDSATLKSLIDEKNHEPSVV